MRTILTLILAITALLPAAAADNYQKLAERAQRSFQWKEWSSAAAMYELMLKQKPEDRDVYVHAIVASQMIPDTAATVDLVERAMAHDLGLGEVLSDVRTLDFSIGQGDRYGEFLLRLRSEMPWMSRALDNQLLGYATFRNDGPMMVHYARIMLAGLPDSAEYLSALARGYALQGMLDEAAATWQQLLKAHPDNYEALLWLGNYELSQDDRDSARQLLSRAQGLRPTPYVANLLESLDNK